MAHVITQNCCKDASCVAVCPVDCIRPDPSDASSAPMLYIDPEACIDCGACVQECPVEAIYPEADLPLDQQSFRELNAAYFAQHPLTVTYPVPEPAHQPISPGSLRVAIVGTGPAALYAAGDLLRVDGVEVNLFDRLPTPFGLIRAGVAPDHQQTKAITSTFEKLLTDPRVGCYLNVEVGRDLTHDELSTSHHAVIYAVGASHSRDLGIPGENLPGSHPASQFVAWYNGHPDRTDDLYDLNSERAVIIGNGNVALDVARILLMTRQQLHDTDIPDRAMEALSDSDIREVILLGRRGSNKRIVFQFDTTPTCFSGVERVTAAQIAGGDVIETGLVLRSIGYLGNPIPGLPFDDTAGVIANLSGRVIDGKHTVPGTYVAGWIKRGANGVIGTNRECAHETVAKLWEDFDAGNLSPDLVDTDLSTLLAERGVRRVDGPGWRAIDATERARGLDRRRPREKLVTVADMLHIAHK